MARYQPLQMQTNTGLKTEVKDFLPIIGNTIPNISISQFDDTDSWVYTATSGLSTGAIDYYNTVRGKGCFKITQTSFAAQNSVVNLSRTYTTPINIINFGSEQNNQSNILRTGKYGADIDKFYLTLNLKIASMTDATTSTIIVNIYNGTKMASATMNYNLMNKTYWLKRNIAKLDGGFTYTNGFTLADYESVTKIEFIMTYNVTTSGGVTIYFQDLWSAIPENSVQNVLANAYYQEPTFANCYFVSEIFGNDANNGTTRALAVRTMDKAMSLMASTPKVYIMILDSETYKPVDIVGNQAGWLSNYPTGGIWADYLETPTLSAVAGNSSTVRQGSRTYFRSRYFTTGTAYYVGKLNGSDANAGTNPLLPKLTIGAAIVAAGANNYVEIIDSGVYAESVSISQNVKVQAAPKQTPQWLNNGATYCLSNNTASTTTIYGIKFSGNSVANEKLLNFNTAAQTVVIEDCTFLNIGFNINSTLAKAITFAVGGNLNFVNNIYVDNAAKTAITIGIDFPANTAGALYTIAIKNNNITLSDTAAIFFQYAGNYYTGQALVRIESNICNNNVSTNSYGSAEALFFNFLGTNTLGAGTPGQSIYLIYNQMQAKVKFRFPTQKKMIFYAYSNLFYGSSSTSFVDFNDSANTLATDSVLEISNSKFLGLYKTGSGIYLDFTGSNTTVVFHNNIFSNLENGLYYALSANSFTSSNNIYYQNTNGAQINGNGVTATSSGIIFQENTVGIKHSGVGSTTISSGYFYLNQSDTFGSVTITTKYSTDPKIINPAKNNFSLSVDSPLNSQFYYGYPVVRTVAFISHCQWLNVVGDIGYSIYSNDLFTTICNVKYCYITNFEIGSLSGTNLLNCYMYGNAIAHVGNNSSAYMICTVKYNIFDTNNSAIYLGLGDWEYNTIINSTQYGVYDGSNALVNTNQNQKIFINNIVEGSGIYDWSSNVNTDYCCIGSRINVLFASNPYTSSTSIIPGNLLTAGAHDINANALLNKKYSMIALKSMGYYGNDPCYLTDSTGLYNIGARYTNYVHSTLTYNNYVFGSQNTGTADVWAYENPNHFKYSLIPINLNSVRTLDGTYYASPTGYTREYTLSWDTAGDVGRININLKNALEMAFKTFWIIGLSYDNGLTYTYYKLKKENNLAMDQQKYLHDTLPYGNSSIILIELPSFLITDYLLITSNMI